MSMTTEQTIQLIARVLAWQDGAPMQELEYQASKAHFQDAAQQCAEDLGVV